MSDDGIPIPPTIPLGLLYLLADDSPLKGPWGMKSVEEKLADLGLGVKVYIPVLPDIPTVEQLQEQLRYEEENNQHTIWQLRNLLQEAGELIKAYARDKTLDVPDMTEYAEKVYAAISRMLNPGIESDAEITLGD